MSEQSNIYKQAYRNCNGQLIVAATDGDATLITAGSTTEQIFITKIVVTIKTSAAQTITFEDSASSAVYVCKVPSAPTVDTQYTYNFGERGFGLTVGKDLVMNVSAAGVACSIVWEGYRVGAGD